VVVAGKTKSKARGRKDGGKDPDVVDLCRIADGKGFRLADHDPAAIPFRGLRKLSGDDLEARSRAFIQARLPELHDAQTRLWAHDRWAVLIVLQAMDAGGKDGVIRHVMSGVNPQGCRIENFKQPTSHELDHDFLWRCSKALPERGGITIFNRSHYEEVLVARVHPEVLDRQRLPPETRGPGLWRRRYDSIVEFERHLVRSGTVVLKFFLHVSREEQRRRFLDRIAEREKHWKFSAGDVAERAHWDRYMDAYERAIRRTSTRWAPWHVVPADNKWAARAVVAEVVTRAISDLHHGFPEATPDQRAALAQAQALLEAEAANKGQKP
jgi:PPK2 family polyphosphate:nucleotide phosphotransferase